jgi:hypothetical protein
MDDLMEVISAIRQERIGAIGDLYQLQMDEGPPVTMRIPPRREKEAWLPDVSAGAERRGRDWGRQAVSCPPPIFLESVERDLLKVLKKRGITSARSALTQNDGVLIPLPVLRARAVSVWLRESIFEARIGQAKVPAERLVFWNSANDWIQAYLLQWISLHGRSKQTPDQVAQERLRAGILSLARGGASAKAKAKPALRKSTKPRKSSRTTSCSANKLRLEVERRLAALAKKTQEMSSKRPALKRAAAAPKGSPKAPKRSPKPSGGSLGVPKRSPKAPR